MTTDQDGSYLTERPHKGYEVHGLIRKANSFFSEGGWQTTSCPYFHL